MKASTQKKLEAAGWRFGTVEEFLGLTKVETALIELRLALSRAIKDRRQKLRLTQGALAKRIESSQSRVAKMEACDPEVSIDLLMRGLLATGATRRDVAKVIEARSIP